MGIRVVKTAIASVLALYLAHFLGFQNIMSAGLLAILGTDVTRKKSIQSAVTRIAATFLGLLYGIAVFYVFGFHLWAIAIYILGAYPVLSRMDLKDGIVTSSVIVLQLFFREDLSLPTIWNQIGLLFIGLGSAMAVNLAYMPSWDAQIRKQRERFETAVSEVFAEIAEHLRNPNRVWSGRQLIDAVEAVREGKELAKRASDNNLFQRDNEWISYFHMRERQLEILQHMLTMVAKVYEDLPHGEMVANLFDLLSRDVKVEYYTGEAERKLRELTKTFEGMPLPETRREFETRAVLLQLMYEIEAWLTLSQKSKRKKPID